MPRSERSRAKDTAWKWFSKYIRLRDCLKTTGKKDRGKCVTCNKEFPFKQLQAGHCIGGRNDSILFDEELVNAQCAECNRSVTHGGKGGNYAKYHLWYIRKYGEEGFEEKIRLSNQIKKISGPEFREISDEYRLKYKELKST